MKTTDMATTPVIVEKLYDAPIEKVWRALTDISLIKQWYFDIKEFKAEPGFSYEFLGGDDKVKYLHRCELKEVIPNKKLSFSWEYKENPGYTLVTIDLKEENGKTRIKLTHEGLENLSTADPNFRKESFNAGWESIIGKNLKAVVEKDN